MLEKMAVLSYSKDGFLMGLKRRKQRESVVRV